MCTIFLTHLNICKNYIWRRCRPLPVLSKESVCVVQKPAYILFSYQLNLPSIPLPIEFNFHKVSYFKSNIIVRHFFECMYFQLFTLCILVPGISHNIHISYYHTVHLLCLWYRNILPSFIKYIFNCFNFLLFRKIL